MPLVSVRTRRTSKQLRDADCEDELDQSHAAGGVEADAAGDATGLAVVDHSGPVPLGNDGFDDPHAGAAEGVG